MLCQQSKLPRGTCKELLKSANLRTYKAFCSWKLDNFGEVIRVIWKALPLDNWFFWIWFCSLYTFSKPMCSEIFLWPFWVLSESKKHAETQVLKINHNNCGRNSKLFHTSFSSFSQSNNFSPFYFGDVLHPLSWTETPKILETNNKIPKNIDRLSNGYDRQCWVVLWSSYNLFWFLVSEWTGKEPVFQADKKTWRELTNIGYD
jgi:hypothetical protein